MGDCNNESKSECCQTKSSCDSGHNEAHAWMASRISSLEKRANCTCKWLGFVTVVLLCIASFMLGRCSAKGGCFLSGGGGPNKSCHQGGGGPNNSCHPEGVGRWSTNACDFGGGSSPCGSLPPVPPMPPCPSMPGCFSSNADVQIQGKAIIVGPDGQTREIDLSQGFQGIDVSELMKSGGKCVEVRIEREEGDDDENAAP